MPEWPPKSVGATLLRIYRGLWTTLRCYMRGVPRRDIDLYQSRVNGAPGTPRPSRNILRKQICRELSRFKVILQENPRFFFSIQGMTLRGSSATRYMSFWRKRNLSLNISEKEEHVFSPIVKLKFERIFYTRAIIFYFTNYISLMAKIYYSLRELALMSSVVFAGSGIDKCRSEFRGEFRVSTRFWRNADIIYFNPGSLADRAGRWVHSYEESRIPEVIGGWRWKPIYWHT